MLSISPFLLLGRTSNNYLRIERALSIRSPLLLVSLHWSDPCDRIVRKKLNVKNASSSSSEKSKRIEAEQQENVASQLADIIEIVMVSHIDQRKERTYRIWGSVPILSEPLQAHANFKSNDITVDMIGFTIGRMGCGAGPNEGRKD